MSRNQLDRETSPYLLAHKDNPVHWRPWTQEALQEAEAAGKPILLSIGYAACHWCHVMNRESFADAETAALLNAHFLPIKVDREERPDLDQIYQAAANAMGHAGGWPLTMFLTPKGEPYFAGGYFPKDERPGLPAFKTALGEAARVFREQPEATGQATRQIGEALNFLWKRDTRGPFHPRMLDDLAIHFAQRFDIFFGGMTGAPKFPVPGLLENLWRAYLRTGLEQFNQVVQTSLNNMCMGGIYDHVGGGFARYATDERWLVPHFEKMLYDNAQLIEILTLAWQQTRSPLYRDRVAETIAWALREMRMGKAFAASLDAETDGEEGKYYLWSEAEVDAALKGTFMQRFKEIYGVTRDGNYQGRNILHRLGATAYPLSDADEALLAKQRSLMLEARAKRTQPKRDDKVLADCNGLMIAGLALAGSALRTAAWINAAIEAFDFVATEMADGDLLFHTWHDGTRGRPGFAEDYALMARAGLALYEATGETRYLERARAWTATLDTRFWDDSRGGYFTSATDEAPLFVRPRMIFDQLIPAANGVMVAVLIKLFLLTGDTSYRDRCNRLVESFAGELQRSPLSMASFLNGLDTAVLGLQIVIVGEPTNAKTRELINAVYGRSLPARQLSVVGPRQQLPEGHPAQGKTMQNGQPTAYVCQGQNCSPPITNPLALSQALLLPVRLAEAQMQAQRQAQQPAQRQTRTQSKAQRKPAGRPLN